MKRTGIDDLMGEGFEGMSLFTYKHLRLEKYFHQRNGNYKNKSHGNIRNETQSKQQKYL